MLVLVLVLVLALALVVPLLLRGRGYQRSSSRSPASTASTRPASRSAGERAWRRNAAAPPLPRGSGCPTAVGVGGGSRGTGALQRCEQSRG